MTVSSPASALMTMGFAAQHGAPHLMATPHRHDDIELNFVETGALTYLFGGQSLTVRPGRLSIFWAAMPHRVIQVEEGTRFYWLTLPLGIFLHWQLPEPFVANVLAGYIVAEQDTTRMPLDHLLMQAWHADLIELPRGGHAALCLEVEARLRRLASAVTHPLPLVQQSNAAQQHTEQMAQLIAQRFDQPLTCVQIAQAVKLHPHYAMTIFRETTGMSLLTYLTHFRLAQAQRLLVTTDLPIATIAFTVGFGSLSQFYAAFKGTTLTTPYVYRRSFFQEG